MKVDIIDKEQEGSAPYAHLVSVVEFLIQNGNVFSEPVNGFVPNEFGFYQDRDGWKCDLAKPIDFELLKEHFNFPKTILLNQKDNVIFCKKSWIEIRGNIGAN